MAANKSRKKVALPNPGDVFYYLDDEGVYRACRVIRSPSAEEPYFGTSVLVGRCQWSGDQPPDLADPALLELANGSRPSRDSKGNGWVPNMFWVCGALPPEMIYLGTLAPNPSEATMECLGMLHWSHFGYQKHETTASAAPPPPPVPEPLTLSGLRRQARLTAWTGEVPPRELKAVRATLRETLNGLEEAEQAAQAEGSGTLPAKAEALVRGCIQRLNEIDAKGEPFIMTIEREDLCELCCKMLEWAGVADVEDIVDSERDW